MNIRFPLRLVRKGPGYYLIDASEHTVTAMTADKDDAEFICRSCNSFRALLEACQAALHLNTEETSSGSEFYRKMCAVDEQLRAAITQATSVG